MASLTVPSRPDIELADGPSDTVAALAFSPAANHLAVASWDSKLRIYDLTQSPTGQGKALISFDGPVLNCEWLKVHNAPPPLLTSETARSHYRYT
jgi:mRNA export factor